MSILFKTIFVFVGFVVNVVSVVDVVVTVFDLVYICC